MEVKGDSKYITPARNHMYDNTMVDWLIGLKSVM